MEEFKLKVDRPKPDPDKLRNGQDFNRLMQAYNKARPPFYRTMKFWGLATAVLMIGGVAWFLMLDNSDPEAQTEPLAQVEPEKESGEKKVAIDQFIQYDVSTFDASEGGTVGFEGGFAVKIPANALLDPEGNPVEGEVQMEFKDWSDPEERERFGIKNRSRGKLFHDPAIGCLSQRGSAPPCRRNNIPHGG